MKILDIPQSGSLGNQTSSRNRSGQYRRQRSLPTQPRTAAQVNARARLTSLSAAWRGLTDAQRASWTAFGNSFSVVNSLGQAINLTGSQCYVKVNAVNLLNGDAVSDTPPALPSFDPATVTGVTGDASTPELSIQGTTPTSPTKFMIYASPQRSAGVSFNGDFRYIKTFTTATGGDFDVSTDYTTKLGTLVAGKKIFVKVVQSQNGMQDNGTLFATIVTT